MQIPNIVTYEGKEYIVTKIGEFAFYRCSELTSVNIPSSVTGVGYCAFYECTSLNMINIPNSVTIIEESAFEDCEMLTSITIPISVTNIAGGAFSFCKNLLDVYSLIKTPFTINISVFDEATYKEARLHVPENSKSQYMQTETWKNFINIVPDACSAIHSGKLKNSNTRQTYDVRGIKLDASIMGLNIVRMSDGKTRKIMLK